MSTSMGEVALSYAKRGWAILPLYQPLGKGCSCPKGAECSSPGKHPRIQCGVKDASADLAQIVAWWSRWPNANIGIATGECSGLLVLDIDNHGNRAGEVSLARLADEHGGVPRTLSVKTGGGVHLYFRHPGSTVGNSIGKIGPGIDVRSDGGYVVAAPSLHISGRHYEWLDPEHELADIPMWLLNRMISPLAANDGLATTRTSSRSSSILSEGARNNGLFNIACELRGQQAMDAVQLKAVLREMNRQLCTPPLDDSEVDAIGLSACKYPAELGSSKKPKRAEQNPLYWFQFNVRSWLGDQNLAVMSDAQTGQYIWLKAYAWQRGGFLPADKNKLWKLAHASSKRAFERDCDLVLAEYEEVDMDGERLLKNQAMVEEWTRSYAAWQVKVQAGQASAAQRALERQQLRDTSEPPRTTTANNN